ncbi:uncharacterized protein [Chelonus insularis]|uniref:uncharacterized protein n=1 Tax=Chelonus insularis TaxID=460826 RepID=UPI00158CF22B|nr:uncharacterized protein LOC118074308 [Chelonus insularis]
MSFEKCAEIQEHLNKYLEEEKNLQAQLHQRKLKQEKKEPLRFQKSTRAYKKLQYSNNTDAIARNQRLLKELEVITARLRTLTSFTPTNRELQESISNYWQSIADN